MSSPCQFSKELFSLLVGLVYGWRRSLYMWLFNILVDFSDTCSASFLYFMLIIPFFINNIIKITNSGETYGGERVECKNNQTYSPCGVLYSIQSHHKMRRNLFIIYTYKMQWFVMHCMIHVCDKDMWISYHCDNSIIKPRFAAWHHNQNQGYIFLNE